MLAALQGLAVLQGLTGAPANDRHGGLGQDAVGNEDGVPVAGFDGSMAPADGGNAPFGVADVDPVAHLDRAAG